MTTIETNNPDVLDNHPDEVTAENRQTRHPNGKGLIRLKARGITICADWNTEGPMEYIIAKHATVLWERDAESGSEYVGSMHSPLTEIAYEIEGMRRYCYVLHTAGIDDWCQECWTTDHRLTAQAAFDTLMAARDFPATQNPTEGDAVVSLMNGRDEP